MMKITNRTVSNKSKTSHGSSSFRSSTLARHAKASQNVHAKKTDSRKSHSNKRKRTGAFFAFFVSPRAIRFYGILLLAFALLLFVSICSFYFHPNHNISHVNSGTAPHNIARTVGAHLSYFFIEYSFGVFSIGFSFLFFLYGTQLAFKKTLLPPVKTTVTTLLTMAWLSLCAGLFCHDGLYDFISGFFGNYLSELMLPGVGKLVTALIMIVFLAAILILCYDLSPKWITIRKTGAHDPSKPESEPVRKSHCRLLKLFKRSKKNGNSAAATERQNLPGLYIEDREGISKEYQGKIYEFPNDDTVVSHHAGNVTDAHPEKSVLQKNEETTGSNDGDSDAKADRSPKSRARREIPFEIISGKAEDAGKEDTTDRDNSSSSFQTQPSTADEVLNLEPYDPKKELSNYQFPSIDLLNDYPAKEASEELMRNELMDNKKRIESTLLSFNIQIKLITATVGPTVTLYEIVPEDGIRISKIKNLEDDIALSLSALGIRIIAPIPGRGTIGIEVPNKHPNIVSMKEVISSERFKNNRFELPIGLGKTINNEAFVVDLAKMPHLLIAGATGQGKSVGLNAAITSLLYTKHPSELKFVLIDPKKVEFTLYSAIENYYLAKLPDSEDAIITDTKKVVHTLNALCEEMDQRYNLLKMAKTRNIHEYNAKFRTRCLSPVAGHRYLPYIVLIIDEFGDLIMTAGREVEIPLARLAQLARAIGIHLIIATQRPSVNIITGSIKANFPARIAFRVSSKIDSRTILDSGGADQLIGKGDLLISTGSDLIRLQCAFVDTPEVEKIVNSIEKQIELSPLLEPFELPDVPENTVEGAGLTDENGNPNEIDPMLPDAATLIVQSQQGSTSFIQRRLKLGYNRAGRIMDQLEELGIVGPSAGSKAREVLVKTEATLNELLRSKGFYS